MEDIPQLVMNELPDEMARMEAALAAAREAIYTPRDSPEIREVDINGYGDDSGDGFGSTPLFNIDALAQGMEMYTIDVEGRMDRHGRIFFQFDDRRQMPLLVVLFQSAAGRWLTTVNDVLMPLDTFHSIVYAHAVVKSGNGNGGGGPALLPSAQSLVCKTVAGAEFVIPHATVPQLMRALTVVNTPQAPGPAPQPAAQQPGPAPHPSPSRDTSAAQ